MIREAKNASLLLNEAIADYEKALNAQKDSKNFTGWSDARDDMRRSIGSMSGLIDTLVLKYNEMAKRCGVTARKAIVQSIEHPLQNEAV